MPSKKSNESLHGTVLTSLPVKVVEVDGDDTAFFEETIKRMKAKEEIELQVIYGKCTLPRTLGGDDD